MQCHVLAPSKMERPSGDRVKTDKRDSEWIARLVRLGELPVVVIPSESQEAARDLVRAREDVRGDLMRSRHRLSKLLLRQGIVYEDTAWTTAHGKWLRSQSFDKPGVQFAFDEAYDTVLTTLARRDRLDNAILTMAGEPAWAPVVARLGCLRGVGTLTGFGLAVEIGDWHRFTGNSIGSFLGLTPSEHSSGGSRSVGSITKTGNGHARRLLVESSWHHRKPYRLSAEMIRRRDGQSPLVRARADQANRRLNQRWRTFDARSKRPTVAGSPSGCSAMTGAACSTTPTFVSSPGPRCAAPFDAPGSTFCRRLPPGCRWVPSELLAESAQCCARSMIGSSGSGRRCSGTRTCCV